VPFFASKAGAQPKQAERGSCRRDAPSFTLSCRGGAQAEEHSFLRCFRSAIFAAVRAASVADPGAEGDLPLPRHDERRLLRNHGKRGTADDPPPENIAHRQPCRRFIADRPGLARRRLAARPCLNFKLRAEARCGEAPRSPIARHARNRARRSSPRAVPRSPAARQQRPRAPRAGRSARERHGLDPLLAWTFSFSQPIPWPAAMRQSARDHLRQPLYGGARRSGRSRSCRAAMQAGSRVEISRRMIAEGVNHAEKQVTGPRNLRERTHPDRRRIRQ